MMQGKGLGRTKKSWKICDRLGGVAGFGDGLEAAAAGVGVFTGARGEGCGRLGWRAEKTN